MLGSIVAVNLAVLPPSNDNVVALNFILFTVTSLFFTVTVHVAVLPLLDFAVIVALPAFIPFTTPELDTVAILVLLLVHQIKTTMIFTTYCKLGSSTILASGSGNEVSHIFANQVGGRQIP